MLRARAPVAMMVFFDSITPVKALPATEGAFLMVRVRTLAAGLEAWKKAVDVFLRTVGRPSVVGVERER